MSAPEGARGQAVLLLAAGHGMRMGGPKVFTRAGGLTFLERILARCQEGGCPVTLVVDPAFRAQVQALLASLPPAGQPPALRLAEADGTQPMLHSLQAGLALGACAAGFWLWPVDAPFLSPAGWRVAREAVAHTPERLLKPRGVQAGPGRPQGRTGHPLWLPAWAVPRIQLGTWPNGLQGFLTEVPPERIQVLDLPGEVVGDFNTPQQLAALPPQP